MNTYEKIAAVKSEIGALTKKSNNPFFKSKYLELSDLLEAVEPLLEKHKLLLLQPVEGGVVYSKIINVEQKGIGDSVNSWMEIPPTITDPQKIGGCISYFRRYTLASLLAIQQVDDDGNAASKKTTRPTTTNSTYNPKPVLDAKKFQDALKKAQKEGTEAKFITQCETYYTLTDSQVKILDLLKAEL